MYRVIACGSMEAGEWRPGCGWVIECNAIGITPRKICGRCGNWLVFAQASEPQLLIEWCAERGLEPPSWLLNSVPVG